MEDNKSLSQHSKHDNQFYFQFQKISINKRNENFISSFLDKKAEIQNRTKELLLNDYSKQMESNQKKNKYYSSKIKQRHQLQYNKLNDEDNNNYNDIISNSSFKSPKQLNSSFKKKLCDINDEIRNKRDILLKQRISIFNQIRQTNNRLIPIRNRTLKHPKSGRDLFLTKLNEHKKATHEQFSSDVSKMRSNSNSNRNITYKPHLNYNSSLSSSNMLSSPQINYSTLNFICEDSLKHSAENSTMINDYIDEINKDRQYRSRNLTKNTKDDDVVAMPKIILRDFNTNMNLFKDMRSGKQFVITQGLSNLITIGDCFNKMEDVQFYKQRAYIKKVYPLIRRSVEIGRNSNAFMSQYNIRNKSNKAEFNKVCNLLQKTSDAISRINIKSQSMHNILKPIN